MVSVVAQPPALAGVRVISDDLERPDVENQGNLLPPSEHHDSVPDNGNAFSEQALVELCLAQHLPAQGIHFPKAGTAVQTSALVK